jgi:hypothetical protein
MRALIVALAINLLSGAPAVRLNDNLEPPMWVASQSPVQSVIETVINLNNGPDFGFHFGLTHDVQRRR